MWWDCLFLLYQNDLTVNRSYYSFAASALHIPSAGFSRAVTNQKHSYF